MNLLSMYSGIGGMDLAAAWAGFSTVAFCDSDPFCRKLLTKRFPGIPIFEEDTNVSAKSLAERGIDPGGIGIVAGGYPCPGESLAGKRRGAADDRWRWPEMFRVIKELRPRWVCCENVIGHVTLGLDSVLFDLESAGYTARPVTIPACAVGAPHRRERIFIIASNADCFSGRASRPETTFRERQAAATGGRGPLLAYSHGERQPQPTGSRSEEWNGFIHSSEALADPERQGLAFGVGRFRNKERAGSLLAITGSDWWSVEPAVGRVAHGIPHRVDRLRALGNALMPQQIYPIFEAIAELEASLRKAG